MPSDHLGGRWEGAQDPHFVIVVSNALLFWTRYRITPKIPRHYFIPEEGISFTIPGFEWHGHDRMEDNLFFHSRLLTTSAPNLGLSGGVYPDKQQTLNPHVTLPLQRKQHNKITSNPLKQ